jgi:hypothetical protein
MSLTLAAAAKAVRRDKTTLLRAIKKGTISAERDAATGGWLIDPAELHRVYPAASDAADAALSAAGDAVTRNGDAAGEIRELRARLEGSEAAIQFRDEVITDLRKQRDLAQAQLAELKQLTDRRPAPISAPPSRRSWWRWRR